MEFTNVIKFLNDFGNEFVDKCQRNIIKYDAIDTSKLLNSIRYIFKENNTSFEISIEMLEYWKYVENGRKSGAFKKIKDTRKLVSVKKVIPRPNKGKLPTANNLVGKGIKPRPFFNDSIDELMQYLEDGLESAFTKDVEAEMDKITVLLTTFE